MRNPVLGVDYEIKLHSIEDRLMCNETRQSPPITTNATIILTSFARAEAAPILEKILAYEREIAALKHELYDWIDRNVGGVMRSVHAHDLTPEERLKKEMVLAEKQELLKAWEEKLGPAVTYNSIGGFNKGRTTAKIEKIRSLLKDAAERADKHRQRIAQLESDGHVAIIQKQADKRRHEAAKLTAEADRIEADRLAAIKAERAELKRLTGDNGGG